MLAPNLVLYYVENVARSAALYGELMGSAPIEQSEGFAMFKLASGMMLGFWAKATVAPPAAWQGAGGELCFAVADEALLQQHFVALQAKGLTIAQEITEMEFGRTFVALDPDGHRLRVYFPS
ncbi:drug:proton antiporter [Chitinibacter sp. SCUT-21]|uniref:VOC family protein n=1 Tax=Chitinibacter sp. SCUT-21 TaxID=2970891 RepID=UPI0035A6E268